MQNMVEIVQYTLYERYNVTKQEILQGFIITIASV